MVHHGFAFEGGDRLSAMGATWFVSYAYYDRIDPMHRNWENVSTTKNRIGQYNSTFRYHEQWFREVLKMNPTNLNRNSIGIDARETQSMARKLLEMSI